MTPIIQLSNISFTYAMGTAPALRDVTLAIPRGQICAIVGKAGAGKSTLCALCAGFVPDFVHGTITGAAEVNGQDVIQLSVAKLVRHVALVGSNTFSQISGARFSVYAEIAFGPENLGIPRNEIIERVEWALEALNISHLRDRSPYALSGGQQQRMVIAAALAMRPPLLVLDEPTVQLDPPATAELAELLRSLSAQGMTILFAEHRLEWTAELAERVIALDHGAIVADGAPETVLADPRLRELGIGWPRPALIAERARVTQRWPAQRPLPVTFAALAAGLAKAANNDEHAPEPSGAPLPAPQPRDTQPIVALDQVQFSYPSGVHALRGISLAIHRGERVALLGRNGAGKSTLVRHLNALLRPSQGTALVDGVNTRTSTVARCARHVGIVFQDVRNQLFARTVRDELRFGPRNLGYPAAQVDALVEQAIAALDLRDVVDEHPYDLPPARRRLVAIAAVLAMDTPLLVLDEPTAGLDGAALDLLERLIQDLAARDRSVLVVSHDLDFCYETLDRVILMRDGAISLDSRFSALNTADRDTLANTVGLPLELRLHLVQSS